MTYLPGTLVPAMGAVADLELAIASHRMFDQALEALSVLHARATRQRGGRRLRARALLLIGAAGSGKSTLVQHFLDTHPPQETQDGVVMPVAVVEVPPAPSLRAVVDAIYSALGYRAEKALSAEDIVKDLMGKVDLLGVNTMMLDESHHILASRDAGQVTEFLKSLLNRLGCSMVFSGMPELVELHGSLQLSRRLYPDVVLRPYSFVNTAERLEFMSFLATIERNAIDLPEPSGLSDQDTARRLYAASGGLIGIVTKYLSHALLLAKVRGRDRIDLDLLAEIDASWSGIPMPADDIPFDADISFEQGVDVAALLAQAGRVHVDVATNPFRCDPGVLLELSRDRSAKRLLEPQRRSLRRPMKGAGPTPQGAFR